MMKIRGCVWVMWAITAIFCLALGLMNLQQVIGVPYQPSCAYTSLTVSENNDTQSTDPLDNDPTQTSQPQLSSRYTLDPSTHKLCIHYSSTICGHVHFKSSPSLPPFETRDYLILQNPNQFLVISKNSPHQHLQFFLSKKQLHIRHKASQPQIHTFPSSNIFVYESPRLYISYLIQQRHINSVLFLEKTTPDYKQHIFPRQDKQLVVISLPKHRQIMVQVFDVKMRRVVGMRKEALEEWVKGYEVGYEGGKGGEEGEGVEVRIRLSTAAGGSYEYHVDRQLNIYLAQYSSKFSAELSDHNASCGLSVLGSRYRDIIFKEAVAFLQGGIAQIRHLLGLQSLRNRPTTEPPYFPPTSKLSFSSGNKLLQCSLAPPAPHCRVISLGKYLLATPTPVFHNMQIQTLQKIGDQTLSPQPVFFIEQNQIHSEQYLQVYQIHPKTEVQWVAFTKTFVHFYPYNKQSKHYRYARMQSGGLVFEGSEFKGKWNGEKKGVEVAQEVRTQGKNLKEGYVEAQAYFNGMFLELVMVGGLGVRVNLVNGFNGKPVRHYDLKGQHRPEDVFMMMLDNEIFISLYDPNTDKSRLTKIQLFLSTTKKQPQLSQLPRQYTLYSKLLSLNKLPTKYYLLTHSHTTLSILCLDPQTFSNRRPHLYQKSLTPFQRTMADTQLQPYDNILDVYGVAMRFNESVKSLGIVEREGRVYGILKERSREVFYTVEFGQVMKGRGLAFRLQVRVGLVVGVTLGVPLLLLLCLNAGRKRSPGQEKDKREDKKKPEQKPPKSPNKKPKKE